MMRIPRTVAAAALSALCAAGCVAAETGAEGRELPVFRATHLPLPPAVDGKLDDQAWKDVPWTGPLGPLKGSRPPNEPGRVKIGWSHRGIFVAFEAPDREVVARKREHDGFMWEDDCVELFIDAQGAAQSYVEIGVNARNCVFDYMHLRRGDTMRPATYMWYTAGGMRSAVSKRQGGGGAGGGGWSAEVHLPWYALRGAANSPPKADDVWRMNILHMDKDRRGYRSGTLSNTVRGAHDPAGFGRLRFDRTGFDAPPAADRAAAKALLAKGVKAWAWNLSDDFEAITVESAKLGRFKLMGNGWKAERGYGHLTFPRDGRNTGPGPRGVLSAHSADTWAIAPVTSDPMIILLPELPADAARIWYRMEPARKRALDSGRCDGAGLLLSCREKPGAEWRVLADIFVTSVEWSLRTVKVPAGAELRLEVDKGPVTPDNDVLQIAVELDVK